MRRRDNRNNSSNAEFTAQTQVADIVSGHPLLFTPLCQLGICPPYGLSTLEDACRGRSMSAELCADALNLLAQPDYKPQKPVPYSLLPLSAFFVKLQAELAGNLQVTGHHLEHLSRNSGEANPQALLTLFGAYASALGSQAASQAETMEGALTLLYERFYSPVAEAGAPEARALRLASRESALPTAELDDIISLLLRHTSAAGSIAVFSAVIQQLCGLRSTLQGSERIRTKLIRPLVADMARAIAKRAANPKPAEQ